MIEWDAKALQLAITPFIPVELQRRRFQAMPVFTALARRAFKRTATNALQMVQPWYRWSGISSYLDCVAYADRAAHEIPTGSALNLDHATPGRFYSAGIVFFAQAMVDNIAEWLSDALHLPVEGSERNFLKKRFRRELPKRLPGAETVLVAYEDFVKDLDSRRQAWIHNLAGGAFPVADESPFEHPGTDRRRLAVMIDPAITVGSENYQNRVEQCIRKHGHYWYHLPDFTAGIFTGSSKFYLDWLRAALDGIPD